MRVFDLNNVLMCNSWQHLIFFVSFGSGSVMQTLKIWSVCVELRLRHCNVIKLGEMCTDNEHGIPTEYVMVVVEKNQVQANNKRNRTYTICLDNFLLLAHCAHCFIAARFF